jgi:DNA-binding transcriptional LysR family regulator
MAAGVQEDLDQGRLIDLFPVWPDETFPSYVLYPSRHLPTTRLQACLDFIFDVTKL